jgi:hypothetical protein
VLDRPERRRFSLAEMDLLGVFANQAALALDLLLHARHVEVALEAAGGDLEAVASVARALEQLEGDRRDAGQRLLAELARVLEG